MFRYQGVSLARSFAILACAATVLSSMALAQTADSARFSSSNDNAAGLVADFSAGSSSPMPGLLNPEGSGAGAGSAAAASGQSYGHSDKSFFSHMTFELGAGFNRPNANTRDFETWGGNFTVGAGYKFNDRFKTYIDYQFLDDKLTGGFIADVGATGGYAHIWSFTVNPEVDLFPKHANSPYLTGGVGFYRKVTSFTDPQEEEYCSFGCGIESVPVVVDHFSSNQIGGSFGIGVRHKLRWEDHTQVFAEIRYLYIDTPGASTFNGIGSTAILPITVGVRF